MVQFRKIMKMQAIVWRTAVFAAFFFFATFLSISSWAQDAQNQSDIPVPPVLEQFRVEGGTISFMGYDLGVDGWRITDARGDHKYAYSTPEGGVILGVLVRPDGSFATKDQSRALNKQILRGDQSALPGAENAQSQAARVERLYALTEKAGWAGMGLKDAPYIYVFMNTHCDHCQAYWNDLESAVKAGQMQVRFVPFGKIPENRSSGAALLSVDDPSSAWDAFLRGDKAVLGEDKIKLGMLERMDANTKLVDDWKLQGPPFTLYRRPADGALVGLIGRPKNTMLLISDLMKKEEQTP